MYTKEHLQEIVAKEGLEYAILGYLSADKIIDPQIRVMWKEAKHLLENINKALDMDNYDGAY